MVYVGKDGELLASIEIISAEIDTPNLPETLRPEDIGVGVGMQINELSGNTGHPMVYAGDGATVSRREYIEMVRQGRLKPDPRVAQRRRELEQRGVIAATRPANSATPVSSTRPTDDDPWTIYTRDFIRRYALDPEQSQRAYLILDQCKGRRASYLLARHGDLEALRSRVASADQAEQERISEQIRTIELPIQRIFDRTLKPRLDRLPTRKQRTAVDPPPPQPQPQPQP